MAHKTIEPGHSGTGALRRVVRHYVREAVRELHARAMSKSAVHDVRKKIEKSRTVVRLLRHVLGRRRYRRENASLRDAAHALRATRDAQVLVQTLSSLCRAHPALRATPAARGLQGVLRAQRSRLQQQLDGHGAHLAPARRSLEQLRARVAHWPLGKHGWSVLGPGIRRIYKGGRQALPAARPPPPDTALHAWRKQVKHLRYALRMLQPMDTGELSALSRQADELTMWLGRAHDLALLAARAKNYAQQRQADVQPLLDAIEREHQHLSLESLVAGERLYRLRPRRFDRQLAHHWRHWRHGRAAY